MTLNMDFAALVAADYRLAQWTPSPGNEVLRLMLERNGAEAGYATSLVRYPAGSRFPAHVHHGGEEFLVLQGVFSDETGDFPAGSYVRNPIGSRHSPWSVAGCLLFVKLWQMHEAAKTETIRQLAFEYAGQSSGEMEIFSLYADTYEQVSIRYALRAHPVHWSGCEILIVGGELECQQHRYAPFSWIRIPSNLIIELKLRENTVLWVKEGHLRDKKSG